MKKTFLLCLFPALFVLSFAQARQTQENTLADLVSIHTPEKPSPFPTSGSASFSRTLLLKTLAPLPPIPAILNIRIYDPANQLTVWQKRDSLTIGDAADSIYRVTPSIPIAGRYKITWSLSATGFPDSLSTTTLFTYLRGSRTTEHLQSPIITPTVRYAAAPFALENMRFNGYLDNRLDANLTKRLLNIDETGILECYYNRPGRQTWVGEYTGKYLHAASRVWRSTHNQQLKEQMDRIADILIGCQEPDGYLGTYLPEQRWTEWDVWAHKYNLLGLLSYYAATGYEPALQASIKMGDLLCSTFGDSPGQLNLVEHGYHAGMAATSVLEPMTDLYRYTGDKKYLDFCRYIIRDYESPKGPKIISTLLTVGKVDRTGNGKAYEMMSNFTGIVKLYQLTGDPQLLMAMVNAWHDVATYKLYITGTASKGEFFQADYVLPATNDVSMGEGCVTTTWLQFSQAMYYLTGEAKYMDEMEKSIYNHLFAAENPETGCVSYYTALQGKKPYRCTIDGHCCLASVPRGIAAIPELAFTRSSTNGFSINLYSGETLRDSIMTNTGRTIGIACTVETKFPRDGRTTIRLEPSQTATFRLALRVPNWCRNFTATVDGKSIAGKPGAYLHLDRPWKKGSVIQLSFSQPTRLLAGGLSYPGYVALKRGPQVLALDQALNPDIPNLDNLTLDSANLTPIPLPDTTLPKGWVGSAPFLTKAYDNGKPVRLLWVPFADAGQTGGEVRVWIKKN